MTDPADVDGTAIWAVLDAERRARDLSWRQVASAAGVGPSTLSRMAQGHTPSVDNLVRLARWANTTLDELVGQGDRFDGDLTPTAAIVSFLRSRKDLSPKGADALEAIIEAAYDKLRDDQA